MGKRLYVGNLSWDTNEETLRLTFGADGRTVTDAHIVTDRDTGRPRGFAFIEMSTKGRSTDRYPGSRWRRPRRPQHPRQSRASAAVTVGGGGGRRWYAVAARYERRTPLG